jgi:hypothetical protein
MVGPMPFRTHGRGVMGQSGLPQEAVEVEREGDSRMTGKEAAMGR